jgi:hypothetical protein
MRGCVFLANREDEGEGFTAFLLLPIFPDGVILESSYVERIHGYFARRGEETSLFAIIRV